MPQVVGAVDGVQIEVIGPSNDSKVGYFNRKQHYSINTQATIGSNLVFLDFATGVPGSFPDSRILRHSTLYGNAEQGRKLSMPTETVQDIAARSILLGDGGYPLTPWLIIPYKFSVNFSQSEKKFNKSTSSRVNVERAFGVLNGVLNVERAFGVLKARCRCLLKARCRCLLKRLDCENRKCENVLLFFQKSSGCNTQGSIQNPVKYLRWSKYL